jgi:CopG family transcriptional regulator/antitoxin EndoAI
VEVYGVQKSSNATKEIVVALPEKFVSELTELLERENVDQSEFIYSAVKCYMKEKRVRQMKDSIRKGYIEMAKINLKIASEAFHAETEASRTVERLVSGG